MTLRDEGYISDSGDDRTGRNDEGISVAGGVDTSDVRLTIESATQGEG